MDAGSDHGSAAKWSAIDVEVAGSGLLHGYSFSFPSSFFTMCTSLACHFDCHGSQTISVSQNMFISSWCGNSKEAVNSARPH